MKCLVVDDNSLARAILVQLATRVPSLEIVAECDNAMDAWQIITAGNIDLVLLDIEMDAMSGIELVRGLKEKRPIVIFTTSKPEYAIEAFELNVADYLPKPVTPARFLQAIEKAGEIMKSRGQKVVAADNTFLFFRDANIIKKLDVADILYAEAMGDYVKLFTQDRFYAVHAPLKEVETKLPTALFLKVHRSFVIQVGKIDAIEGGTIIINKKMVPVADSYRNQLNKRLNVL